MKLTDKHLQTLAKLAKENVADDEISASGLAAEELLAAREILRIYTGCYFQKPPARGLTMEHRITDHRKIWDGGSGDS